jgi:hypothetical protein
MKAFSFLQNSRCPQPVKKKGPQREETKNKKTKAVVAGRRGGGESIHSLSLPLSLPDQPRCLAEKEKKKKGRKKKTTIDNFLSVSVCLPFLTPPPLLLFFILHPETLKTSRNHLVVVVVARVSLSIFVLLFALQ